MAQPGAPSRIVLALLWLLLGSAMVAVPVWVGWTSWRVVLEGHPAMLGTILLCGLGGLVALAWALASLVLGGRQDRAGSSDRTRVRTRRQLRRRAAGRVILAVPALAVCALVVGLLAYARPHAATPAAVAALPSSSEVRFANRLTWYELAPDREDARGRAVRPTTGLIFYPGARVDSRAYAATLRPLARAGYLVVVLKVPFGIPLITPAQARSALEVHPEIRYWAVGGHSLGGTAAASFASTAGQVKGLLLWASYPARPVIRTDLKVTSVSGTADGLTTPTDIEMSRASLPRTTRFVPIPGANHASFADYGEQPRDGVSTVPRAEAQKQVVAASAALLASLRPSPRK